MSQVRREIDTWYAANNRAFLAKDLAGIMALRTADFHAVGPDGATRDRAAMQQVTEGLLNGITEWITLEVSIDSLDVEGSEARVVARQHLVRRALRSDGLVHLLESWATQREVFRREAGGWRLYRVDNVHDQRRLIDGKPG
jgi:ketosteroid isomerase-like protein